MMVSKWNTWWDPQSQLKRHLMLPPPSFIKHQVFSVRLLHRNLHPDHIIWWVEPCGLGWFTDSMGFFYTSRHKPEHFLWLKTPILYNLNNTVYMTDRCTNRDKHLQRLQQKLCRIESLSLITLKTFQTQSEATVCFADFEIEKHVKHSEDKHEHALIKN